MGQILLHARGGPNAHIVASQPFDMQNNDGYDVIRNSASVESRKDVF